MKNFHSYIAMYCCSPITGTRSVKLGKLGNRFFNTSSTFHDLLPVIRDKQ